MQRRSMLFGAGEIIDPSQLYGGVIQFFNSGHAEENKRFGKVSDERLGGMVWFHLNYGRQIAERNGQLFIVSNQPPARLPVSGDRIVFYRENTGLGPRALFWALESDLPPGYVYGPDYIEEDGQYSERTIYRVVFREVRKEQEGASNVVYEKVLWEGDDPSEVPGEIWDPRGRNFLLAGSTQYEKVWQRLKWGDIDPPV